MNGNLISNVIEDITFHTYNRNEDNITRTNAYLNFYLKYPEIKWSFLAHMVSRNAGWNMCDLEGIWFPKVIEPKLRKRFFLTFERANWLIFQDVYPQLLLYHYSTKYNQPMFHLLPKFNVSSFMRVEWERFWKTRDGSRLMTALIINEQNVIQKPVIEHPVYKKRVFKSYLFWVQDILHFSCVLFPTMDGQLFGASVSKFRHVTNRISLGKRLAAILFNPSLYPLFFEFAGTTDHTGSRRDYQQYQNDNMADTPKLYDVYPIIEHHIQKQLFWEDFTKINKKWWFTEKQNEPINVTKWFECKQKELQSFITIEDYWLTKVNR